MDVQQAIFTSVKSDTREGYHVAVTSSGVTTDQIKALERWCPSQDALQPVTPRRSVQFFPLGDQQTWCVAKTVAAGAEYSGRGGARLLTRCLLAPTEVWERFRYHGFRVLAACEVHMPGSGMLQELPKSLPAIPLVGRVSLIDAHLLSRLTLRFGADKIAVLAEYLLQDQKLVLHGIRQGELLMRGLVELLPAEVRSRVSVSTGLTPSNGRPFQAHFVSRPNDAISFSRNQHANVIHVEEDPSPAPVTEFGRQIRDCLSEGNYPKLRKLQQNYRDDLEHNHDTIDPQQETSRDTFHADETWHESFQNGFQEMNVSVGH